jgi:hypothetical protein
MGKKKVVILAGLRRQKTQEWPIKRVQNGAPGKRSEPWRHFARFFPEERFLIRYSSGSRREEGFLVLHVGLASAGAAEVQPDIEIRSTGAVGKEARTVETGLVSRLVSDALFDFVKSRVVAHGASLQAGIGTAWSEANVPIVVNAEPRDWRAGEWNAAHIERDCCLKRGEGDAGSNSRLFFGVHNASAVHFDVLDELVDGDANPAGDADPLPQSGMERDLIRFQVCVPNERLLELLHGVGSFTGVVPVVDDLYILFVWTARVGVVEAATVYG